LDPSQEKHQAIVLHLTSTQPDDFFHLVKVNAYYQRNRSILADWKRGQEGFELLSLLLSLDPDDATEFTGCRSPLSSLDDGAHLILSDRTILETTD